MFWTDVLTEDTVRGSVGIASLEDDHGLVAVVDRDVGRTRLEAAFGGGDFDVVSEARAAGIEEAAENGGGAGRTARWNAATIAFEHHHEVTHGVGIDSGPSLIAFGFGVDEERRAQWSRRGVVALGEDVESLSRSRRLPDHDIVAALGCGDRGLTCESVGYHEERIGARLAVPVEQASTDAPDPFVGDPGDQEVAGW